MRIDSVSSPPIYPQEGPTLKASSEHAAGIRSMTEDVQPARSEKPATSQVEDAARIMETARQRLQESGLNIRLSSDHGSERLQIEVFNPETDEVIRRFPPDEIIKLGESIKKMNGLVVNRNL